MGSSDGLTLVYVVRPGETNELLRFSLRSVDAHLPRARVVILGHKPSWVEGVEHVHVPQPHAHRSNVPEMIRQFVEAKVADEWVLMNDDFFALAPDPEIETVYSMALSRLGSMPGWKSGWYWHARKHTEQLLLEQGIVDPLSYDRVHRPMPFNNGLLSSVLGAVGSDRVLVRSLYGNLVGGGVVGEDVKIRGFTTPLPASEWVSTGRESWQGVAGGVIRSRFGAKCRFET